MKKQLATLALAILVGVLGFAVSGVAVAGNGKPPSPPGQDECEHGNAAKPCKDDPQPDKGKDCEEHGNLGGVNEDHCKGEETPPTETPPTETTPTETTPTHSTPTETTPSDTPSPGTVPTNGGNDPYTPPTAVTDEPSSTQATEPEPSSSESSEPTPEIQGAPPVATAVEERAAALGTTANEPKPTRQAQQAPVTL